MPKIQVTTDDGTVVETYEPGREDLSEFAWSFMTSNMRRQVKKAFRMEAIDTDADQAAYDTYHVGGK